MSIIVPDEILTTTRMTEAEMCQEIAVMLFQKEKLTLAQASRFAGIAVAKIIRTPFMLDYLV
jgi:predicted HTH domain antitoxin